LACLSLPSRKISDDKKQATKFTESNTWAVGYIGRPTPVFKVDPGAVLEGCCCSEAFAFAVGSLEDARALLFLADGY